MILGDGYLGQMSEPLVFPKAVEKLPEKDWALTGAKGRDPHIIASLRLNPDNYLEQHVYNLMKIYGEIEENEVIYDTQYMDDADFMIVSYGTCSRICKKAIRALRAEGIKVGLFRPITLWPFPKKEIAEYAKKVKKILTVEMSMGQMVQDVQINAGKYADIDFYGRPGGMLPEVDKIIQRVKSYV